jgi:hypothetical protein
MERDNVAIMENETDKPLTREPHLNAMAVRPL